jgi:glycogen debranching enzyme
MTFNGESPITLAQELRFGGNTVVISMTNRDFPMLNGKGRIPRDTLLIRRVLSLVGDMLYETVELKNFANRDHEIQVEQWAGTRFDDVFEVRGFPRLRRGRMLPALESGPGASTTVFQYEGLDGKLRRTYVQRLFQAEKVRLSPTLTGHFTRVTVPAKGTTVLKTIVAFDRDPERDFLGTDFAELALPRKMALLAKHREDTAISGVTFDSDNAILNRSIENARIDIYMLLTREPGNVLYPYAGIPWFSAPFGRDGLITAYQLLPWAPALARGVLDYVFTTIGKKEDPFTDEQPGKIFHEMRRGEMSNTREVPFIPYYGSVDSTPLALVLLHEYMRWTRDFESLSRWWPDAMKALSWVLRADAEDATGFLGYACLSPSGLVNQGWKDSGDSVMHENGELASSPIRLCEAQAYSFRARMGMAELARLRGEEELSARLRLGALQLRARFMENYWDGQGRFVALALDGRGKPCRVKTSNMGHCLWGKILPQEQARDTADHLVSKAMFSGYGVRTLADCEVAYNPLSYHNGSIWPHDNSIIMEGLRSYGLTSQLECLTGGMMSVLEASDDFRLPELFCGFRRRENAPPVPYEVACKPQAWAAGSIFLMLKAMLGLSMDADQNYFVLHSPILMPGVNTLEVKGLRIRDSEFDLHLRRSSVGTLVESRRRQGSVRVMTVR